MFDTFILFLPNSNLSIVNDKQGQKCRREAYIYAF